MLVLRLAVGVDGLGQAGSLVIADPERVPGMGDWVVIQLSRGYRCQPWQNGRAPLATVIRVLE